MLNNRSMHTALLNKRFKKSLLAISIITISAPLFAQTSSHSEEPMEEVIVRGIRTSLEDAQVLKREANTIKDIITASDIGALPDKSVTEALQRVPGVTIERFASSTDPNHFASEGRGVTVRGLDRVRSEINGRDSFSANSDNGLNYEDIPPELLGRIEVVKNQTADLIAGGVAGTVNLITRKPFDSNDRQIFISAKNSYGDLIDDYSPSVSGLFSDRWDTSAGEFGVLLSLSASEFNARGDGVNLENFYERSATQQELPQYGSTALAARPNDVLYMPHGAQVRTSNSTRDREGLTASLQWANPNETLLATAEYIRSSSHETWHERVMSLGIQGFNAFNDGTWPELLNGGADATFDSRGFFTSGSVSYTVPFKAASRSRDVENVVEDISLHLEVNPTDSLKLDFDVQQIQATSDVYDNTITNAFTNSNMHIDLRGDVPRVTFLGEGIDTPATDNEAYLSSIMDTEIIADGELSSFAIDAEYSADAEWFKGVATGIYYSDREQNIRDDDFSNWGGVSASWATGGLQSGLVSNPRLYEKFAFPDDFFREDGLIGDSRTFLFPRMSDTSDVVAFDEYLIANGISNVGRVNRRNRPGVDADGFLPHERHITSETRQEAYIRFDVENDQLAMPIKSNLGLRYVKYEVEATGSSRFLRAIQPTNSFYPFLVDTYPDVPVFFDDSGTSAITHNAEPYDTVLPTFNLSVGVTDDLILRFAVSKAIYFPEIRNLRNARTYRAAVSQNWRYDDLAPATWDCYWGTDPLICNEPESVSNLGTAGYRGNPDLQPEEADQIDITAEWYFAEVGSLTLSLFDKKISNLIREKNFIETVVKPDGSSREINVRRPTNEGEGTIQGFEFAYQQMYDFLPGIWSGLGLQLNYTYLDQKDLNDKRGDLGADRPDLSSPEGDARNTFRNFTGLGLPGYSDENYNIVGIYEVDNVSFRMAYNWRSKYLLARRDADSFSAIYAKDSGHLDASIFYTLNEYIKVGFEASNLLNTKIETTTQFNQAGIETPKSYFMTDKRYALVVRGTF